MLSYSKVLDDATGLSFGIPLLDGCSLVPYIFAPCQSNLQLDSIVVIEISFEWDNGHARLFGALQQLASFGLVNKQGPDPSFVVLKVRPRHGMFANVTSQETGRAAVFADLDKGILQIHFAVSNGLDFGALEGNARLERFDNFVLKACPAIDANGIVFGLFLFLSRFGVEAR